MTARLGAILRAGRGGVAAKRSSAPPAPSLTLWEYEGSPWCRRVREHLCVLDLSCKIKPSPREALVFVPGPPVNEEGYMGPLSRHRGGVRECGGKLVFPFLWDASLSVGLNESAEICRHLWRHYAKGVLPSFPRPSGSYNLAPSRSFGRKEDGALAPAGEVADSALWSVLDVPTLIAASLVRPLPRHGVMLVPARECMGEVTLYQHEGCAGSRELREALSCLQIEYTSVPCAGGSAHSSPTGKVPCLHVEGGDASFCSDNVRECLSYLWGHATGKPVSPFNRPP
eukprot:CAMPEP_0206244582 /NCGR_PEP_ID=MMETSP0047_2-20121206/18239_1 /ASSEMBLY_ACC=CAM_ASM_000192 /TAXON_ID=195065 /ORGANISM="Chroomonas mesostigmatica_cf, Strain CCMP1168" /LENGTH=283 /DNA_ID=CAMNT_0053669821 /DNA_START=70 /DNA_END=921 /DNA_ORIENTATION=-